MADRFPRRVAALVARLHRRPGQSASAEHLHRQRSVQRPPLWPPSRAASATAARSTSPAWWIQARRRPVMRRPAAPLRSRRRPAAVPSGVGIAMHTAGEQRPLGRDQHGKTMDGHGVRPSDHPVPWRVRPTDRAPRGWRVM